ncbi:MAG: hypothetical protein ACPL3C_03800 [Pyrobaculum sp.]|jgi:hypothetical protein|uniref:hypothetical protein n=1 Tax=Pyrobaculum sp. TaxID=2004705 RepID=UPI003C83AA99
MGSVLEVLSKRLDIALGVEPEPTVESVLAESAKHGVLRGSAYTVFEKWRVYIKTVTKELAEKFNLSLNEVETLRKFDKDLTSLLDKAEKQTIERLGVLQEALKKDFIEMRRKNTTVYICAYNICTKVNMNRNGHLIVALPLHGASVLSHFPNILKLSKGELEAFQIGWRASDETYMLSRPKLVTTQPWQLFAWASVRPGRMRLALEYVHLTARGVSLRVTAVAASQREQWSKKEAQRLILEAVKRGEYRALLTWYLGDGVAGMSNKILALSIKTYSATELGGRHYERSSILYFNYDESRELARKIIFSAPQSMRDMLDLLHAKKWLFLKSVANSVKKNPFYITIRGVKMRLHDAKTLQAVFYTLDEEKAWQILNVLKPYAKLGKDRNYYVVRITWKGLRELIKEDPDLEKAILRFLNSRNSTASKRILSQLNPLF